MNLWCSQPGLPEFTDRWHFSCRTNSAPNPPLSLAQIQEEIDNHRPIAFSWREGNDDSHMMVLIGYDAVNQTVTYFNPEYGKDTHAKIDPLSKYQSTVNPVHELDFYNIQVEGMPQ
jgi:hypothetical protein